LAHVSVVLEFYNVTHLPDPRPRVLRLLCVLEVCSNTPDTQHSCCYCNCC